MVQSPAPPPGPSPPSTWNPFVFTVIGVICTIFLVLSYYKILKRHCLTRGSSMLRSRSDRQLFNEANPDDASLQFHSRGLDSSILYCLPTIQYRNKSEDETDKNNKECSVCLGEFEDGDWLRLLPNCTHSFHIACIDTWFESHSNCPLCRSHIIYDLTDHHAMSMLTLLENLRREDVIRETTGSSQVVHFESLRIMRAQQSPN